MGDDIRQIVINKPVHSIANLPEFFTSGTFYNGGQEGTGLGGGYYRPMMTTSFSLLYTIFGDQPTAFHLFQLAAHIAGARFLFLFLRYSFSRNLSLFLALAFLLHPINSQVGFSIPYMQDALFFMFGIMALWVLIKYDSMKGIAGAALLLLLSLLSKETGVLFVLVCALYMFWYNRPNLKYFTAALVLPVIIYASLRYAAVGFVQDPGLGPISEASFIERLINMPSLFLFYVVKLIAPIQLASGYYWVNSTFSVNNFLIPLIIDTVIIGGLVYAAILIKKRATIEEFYAYLFFLTWLVFGALLHSQIIPLDFTANESWFYFTFAGLLGLSGVVWTVFGKYLKINHLYIVIAASVLIFAWGIRTAVRGTESKTPAVLAANDVKASKEHYTAYKTLATEAYMKASYQEAAVLAQKSIDYFPTGNSYNILGTAYMATGDFDLAVEALTEGMKHPHNVGLYDNLASITSLTTIYGSIENDRKFLKQSLDKFPNDANLWYYLALLEYKDNNLVAAKEAISKAYSLAPTNEAVAANYQQLLNNKAPAILFNPNPVSL